MIDREGTGCSVTSLSADGGQQNHAAFLPQTNSFPRKFFTTYTTTISYARSLHLHPSLIGTACVYSHLSPLPIARLPCTALTMAGQTPGLEFSKWAKTPAKTSVYDANDNDVKGYLATNLDFWNASVTPKSKSVPSLATSLAPYSSSPSSSEVITPEKALASCASIKKSVHQLASEAIKNDESMSITPELTHSSH